MKKMKFSVVVMAALIILSGCGMNNTAKGGLIGGGAGAGIGAMVGNLIGRNAGGTLAGAGIGAAVGTAAGVLIGRKMDKMKAAAEQVQNAQVEGVKDSNGLDAVKSYMLAQGAAPTQIKSSTGFGENNPVADNSTKEGKAQNRRVEIYLYASEAMINAANAGTLQ